MSFMNHMLTWFLKEFKQNLSQVNCDDNDDKAGGNDSNEHNPSK